jgi:hypothetical protein
MYLRINDLVITIEKNLALEIWNSYYAKDFVIPFISDEVYSQKYFKTYLRLYFDYLRTLDH